MSEEYYAYDFTSFLADIGGNLGLLLGWSALTLMDCFEDYWKKMKPKLGHGYCKK